MSGGSAGAGGMSEGDHGINGMRELMGEEGVDAGGID